MEDFFLFTKMTEDSYLVVLPPVTVVPRTFLQHFVSLQYVNLEISIHCYVFNPEVMFKPLLPLRHRQHWTLSSAAGSQRERRGRSTSSQRRQTSRGREASSW